MLGLREALKVACSRLSDSGEGAKEWGRLESVGRAKIGAGRESFLPFVFMFALSQFCGPDYFGAWNRLPLK